MLLTRVKVLLAVLLTACTPAPRSASRHLPPPARELPAPTEPELAALTEGRAWFGIDNSYVLDPSGTELFVEGMDPARLGLPVARDERDWMGGTLTFPEPLTELTDAMAMNVGAAARTADGRVYAWGWVRPGYGLAPAPVALPGPAVHLTAVWSGACASVRGHDGLYCWGGRLPHREVGEGLWQLPTPCAVRALASTPGLLCSVCTDDTLRCWHREDGVMRPTPPTLVAHDVRDADGGSRVCFVQGPNRTLYCMTDHASAPVRMLSSVDDFAVGGFGGRACAVAQGWLHCWGRSSLFDGWIVVGPNGIDPSTVPRDEMSSVRSELPRPVLPVTTGTEVMFFGSGFCVRSPGGRARCVRFLHAALGSFYAVDKLPPGTRPYPGRRELDRELRGEPDG